MELFSILAMLGMGQLHDVIAPQPKQPSALPPSKDEVDARVAAAQARYDARWGKEPCDCTDEDLLDPL